MCCIFTCLAWIIDLIQRAWVFAMSCCVSSAVCCVIMISSMSGVALGYNYSLAEYIDLKETNVSIYVKRGVFDDDVGDDMAWRRSGGHEAVRSYVKDEGDLMTQPPEEGDTPLRSGRRLDNSIIESDDHNRFEGSLMKLTAKPIHPLTTTAPVTSDEQMQAIVSKYPQGSLDQLKAIQSLISMRKAQAARDTTVKGSEMSTYAQDERYVPNFPNFPPDQARRMMGEGALSEPEGYKLPPGVNPARFAVPDAGINDPSNWMIRKYTPKKSIEYDVPETYPRPIIYKPGPIRPTKLQEQTPTHTTSEESPTMKAIKAGKGAMDREMHDFKEKLILDKYEFPRQKGKDPAEPKGPLKSGFDYYDDDIKGLPVRRKRNINRIKRKAPRTLHQKLLPQSASGKDNRITNEISSYPGAPVSRLLRLAPGESLKTKMNVSENDNLTTDRIVNIIRSMFS